MEQKQAGINVFYSYASADKEWYDQLTSHLSQLRRNGLISEWSDQQILPGSNRVQVIDQALHSAHMILLLISADFLASDTCYQEDMQHALEHHQRGESRVIPIIVRPCDWQSSPFAHLQYLPRNGQPITTWNNPDEAFVDVVAGIRNIIKALSPVPYGALPAIWNIPYQRNSFFSGREDLLLHLHAQLRRDQPMAISQRPQAISGLGGIGKTQIAVEYAYRFGQEYQAVLWAHADSIEALISSYATFAILLNLPEQHTQEHTIIVQAVKRWLQTHREWLLILDNADELAVVPEFLPPALSGHLLLTTRAHTIGGLANRIEVETFSPEQGAVFLLRRAALLPPDASLEHATVSDREQAVQITKVLGGLPLALDQAGAYLQETGCNLLEYQQLYQQHRAVLLEERWQLVDDDHPPVATTWLISFERVEEKNPAAADLLRLCAFLQPEAIPEEIILEGGEGLGPRLHTLATNPLAFYEAIRTLRSCSLLQRSAGEQHLSIHRLVQVVLQDSMPEHERTLWRGRLLQALSIVFPVVEDATWRRCERLIPHVLLYAAETGEQVENPELATVLEKAADYLRQRGQYEQAEPLYLRVLRIQEHVLGSEDPQVASLLNRLASLARAQNKYKRAELLYQQALRIQEQAGGPEYLDAEVASSLIGLGVVYGLQGKYEQAEPLYQRALLIQEKRLASNPSDATAYLQRGYVYLLLKNSKFACTDFAKYASLQTGNTNAEWMVIYAALSKQHPGIEIAERLEVIAELDSHSQAAYVCRGVALWLRNKLQEGLTTLEEALDLDAHNQDAWFWKGMLCVYLGKNTVAMESIEQALQSGLPPLLLTPLHWLEQENPQFYQEYAKPLLKRHELL